MRYCQSLINKGLKPSMLTLRQMRLWNIMQTPCQRLRLKMEEYKSSEKTVAKWFWESRDSWKKNLC
jgi:hypothetical protein